MSLYEYAGNLHIHTRYSDGQALHADVAQAAGEAGLDFVITTDHNVWVDGVEGYYGDVLLLVGEEIHDVRRRPQANHLLAYDIDVELFPWASDPQTLIETINKRDGLSFLAHPNELGSPISHDLDAISWQDWDVSGYHGLEIWNYMSEFKSLLRNKLMALFYAYLPAAGISGPFRATLRRWDKLLAQGQRVTAIGSADAHGDTYSMGPLSRVVLPYAYLFRCVNTHVLTERPFNGDLTHDKALIYEALRASRTWVGYDLLGSTEGFRFRALSGPNQALMGEEMKRTAATTFEVKTPQSADIRLLRTGEVVAKSKGTQLSYTTAEPGVYRVEAYRRHWFLPRGWIFSNPIYVK